MTPTAAASICCVDNGDVAKSVHSFKLQDTQGSKGNPVIKRKVVSTLFWV